MLGHSFDDETAEANARAISQLPKALGGLGLRCATRVSAAAYWSSWVDALPMIQQRAPYLAQIILARLEAGSSVSGTMTCLDEANMACGLVMAEGFTDAPTWRQASQGVRPAD
eukprot:7078586-Karenia_brevis.AAC.1